MVCLYCLWLGCRRCWFIFCDCWWWGVCICFCWMCCCLVVFRIFCIWCWLYKLGCRICGGVGFVFVLVSSWVGIGSCCWYWGFDFLDWIWWLFGCGWVYGLMFLFFVVLFVDWEFFCLWVCFVINVFVMCELCGWLGWWLGVWLDMGLWRFEVDVCLFWGS